MKSIADYQPSGVVTALVEYAAGWHDSAAAIPARGAVCVAVAYEMCGQGIYDGHSEWSDAAIAEASAKRAA